MHRTVSSRPDDSSSGRAGGSGTALNPARLLGIGLLLTTLLTMMVAPGWATDEGREPAAGAVSGPSGEENPEGAGLETDPEPQQTGDSSISPLFSNLTINGYLSQAYGFAQEMESLGLPTDGTSDYRTAALVFRYAATQNDSLVLQLSHERQGESPFGALRESVELDWVFYERRFQGETKLRVGRMPIPFGIFNELRDVGTELPFYRPPVSIYGEEFFTTENLDGVVVSRIFAPRSLWKTELDVYFGRWEVRQLSLNPAEAENAAGARIWLSTPLSGLRVGGGWQRQTVDGLDNLAPGVEEKWNEWHGSVDGQFYRFVVRGEVRQVSFDLGGRIEAYYVQVGINATEQLSFNLQVEEANLFFPPEGPLRGIQSRIQEDFVLGVNYAFLHNLVLKLEYHWSDGFFVSNQPDFFPRIATDNPYDTDHSILSLAFSF